VANRRRGHGPGVVAAPGRVVRVGETRRHVAR
jgi:hypothetical protein